MSALTILAPGVFASIQDAGRHGWRRAGVPRAGALDTRLLRIANTLVGNPATAPAIECIDGGLRVEAQDGPVRVATAGEATLVHIDCEGQAHPCHPWRSLTLAAGEQLRLVSTGHGRIAMLAIAGLTCPSTLGSASTYTRAALGGLDGRALQSGDRLDAAALRGPERILPTPPAATDAPIHVVPGPQADHFASFDAFLEQSWTLSTEADRMGLRLRGEALVHASDATREIVSDALVPGAIQVPGNGQPIVLLADSQTAGGYPKIATVISADLGRIAALKPGQALRFAAVTVDEAEALARAAEADTRQMLGAIAPLKGEAAVDLDALYGNNLLSGMVNALSPDEADDSERST